MEVTPIINEDASVAYLPGFSAAVSMEVPEARPSTTIQKLTGSNKIAFWGDSNTFPQDVIKDGQANTIVASTLGWKARALYAGGISYGVKNAEGKPEAKILTEVEDFFKKSAIRRYLLEAATDLYWFYNVFPELILSNDRSEIVQLSVQPAEECRWERQDPSTGLSKKCYVNANWENGGKEDDSLIIPAIDPYYDPAGTLHERTDGFKYIYPLSYPTPGKKYYQLAEWNSIRESGWLTVAQNIPSFKKALLKNQITIKYHIQIADYYWKWKYENWDQLDNATKKANKEATLKELNDFLTGVSNAGKSLLTSFKTDPQTGKQYPGIDITAVDDKIKDGMYIEDSMEASSHLLYALGVDPTLPGLAPGKGMGAGSGSDKREAFNMYLTLCQAHADIILEPLNFIRDYNGWDPNLVFWLKQPTLQTLDKVSPSQRDTKPSGNGAV